VELTCDILHAAGQHLQIWDLKDLQATAAAAPMPGDLGMPSPTLKELILASLRLLSPHMDESQSVFVGSLVLELLLQHPATLQGPLLQQLLDAVVVKVTEDWWKDS
jgi:hypothetical protein